MSVAVNRVTNANVYVDGTSRLGLAEEITLPEIKSIMSEHKAVGMKGQIELPAGIEKMEAKIKWNSYDAAVMAACGNPTQLVQLQCRSSMEQYEASGKTGEVGIVIHFSGYFKNLPLGSFKANEQVDITSQLTVQYVKLVIDGDTVVEVDVLANIHNVNGVDTLATYRQNLGI